MTLTGIIPASFVIAMKEYDVVTASPSSIGVFPTFQKVVGALRYKRAVCTYVWIMLLVTQQCLQISNPKKYQTKLPDLTSTLPLPPP